MPNYTNAVAATSQVHTYAASLTFLYDNIALIPGIPHKYQIEVERIFTTARAGSPTGIVAFQSDAAVPVEQKRDVYIIPETLNNNTYLTFNETAKTITIAADLSTLNKVYTNPSNTVYVPNIVAGQVITFRRKTISNTPLVTWSSGTKLTSNQLNLETTQLLYLVQEVLDRVYRQISISGDIVSQIADNAITTSKIVDLAVTTGKINDLAVTTAKLADLNVTTGKINDLAVTTSKIADYNITPAKLINTTQAWSLTGTLALTDLATSATGDKVANKNYVLDRVSKYGVITKDSTVTSNVLDTPPTIPTDANDDVSLQSGGIWFNPRDGGLRVRVLDKWVRVTGTPLNITDYISTGGTTQTKTGNLILTNGLNVTGTTTFNNSITIAGNAGIAPTDNLTGLWISGQNAGYPNGGTIVFRGNNGGAGGTAANGLEFYTGGSEKMRITSSGVVGIGPSANTTPVSGERFVIGGSNSAEYMSIKSAAQTFVAGSDTNNTFLGSYSNTPLVLRTNNSEGMRIDSTGKVGIGTTNPTTTLDVNGTTNITGTLTAGGNTWPQAVQTLYTPRVVYTTADTTNTSVNKINRQYSAHMFNLDCTITPRTASSKIKVEFDFHSETNQAWDGGGFILARNVGGVRTLLGVPPSVDSRMYLTAIENSYPDVNVGSTPQAHKVSFLDSPNTVQPVTYELHFVYTSNSTQIVVNGCWSDDTTSIYQERTSSRTILTEYFA